MEVTPEEALNQVKIMIRKKWLLHQTTRQGLQIGRRNTFRSALKLMNPSPSSFQDLNTSIS